MRNERSLPLPLVDGLKNLNDDKKSPISLPTFFSWMNEQLCANGSKFSLRCKEKSFNFHHLEKKKKSNDSEMMQEKLDF